MWETSHDFMPRCRAPTCRSTRKARGTRHRGIKPWTKDWFVRDVDGVRSNVGDDPAEKAYERFVSARKRLRAFVLARALLGASLVLILVRFFIGSIGVVGCAAVPVLAGLVAWTDRRALWTGRECYLSLWALKFGVCPDCEYELWSIANAMKCPECGRHVGPEQCRAAWHSNIKGHCGPGAVAPESLDP